MIRVLFENWKQGILAHFEYKKYMRIVSLIRLWNCKENSASPSFEALDSAPQVPKVLLRSQEEGCLIIGLKWWKCSDGIGRIGRILMVSWSFQAFLIFRNFNTKVATVSQIEFKKGDVAVSQVETKARVVSMSWLRFKDRGVIRSEVEL